jgi:hypothetical protein
METKISNELNEQFAMFLQQHPPRSFNNALRNLLMEYMEQHVNIGFRLRFDRFLHAMDDFFKLLDCADSEMRQKPVPATVNKTKRTRSRK